MKTSGTEEGSIDNVKMRRFVQIFYGNDKRRMSGGGTFISQMISKEVGLFQIRRLQLSDRILPN
jgi:hypothetical protein